MEAEELQTPAPKKETETACDHFKKFRIWYIAGALILLFGLISYSDSLTAIAKGTRCLLTGEVTVPFDWYEATSKNYEDIELQLEVAGFTNITTEGVIGEDAKNDYDINDVESYIPINGNTDYEEGDFFPKDAKIVIRYRSSYKSTKATPEPTKATPKTTKDPETETEWTGVLDSYESWVNTYIALMKKLSNNPSDISFLSDYADVIVEQAEWAEQLDAAEDEMSAGELARYIEITAKMIKAIE